MHGRTTSLLILGSIILLIIFANFSPSHFLMGWDNLMPELNIWLNIKRSIFSVWEEYQGLGVLAGNAHAADLPRQVLMLILSFLAPLQVLRWIYVFSLLALGTFSSYFLIEKLLFGKKNTLPAFLGSLFYLLNLATVQNFFIPFEPFITFYGFLPLLLLTSINYIKTPSRKSFFFFVVTTVLSIPLAQVPTMFVVYLFALFFVLLGLYFDNKQRLRSILKIFLVTLLLNSFWLFPFMYFTATNSSVAFSAKINQMSTQIVLAQNKEFGNITDVMLLKGFWFNNIDLTQSGYFAHMFDVWRGHLENSLITLVGYFSFFIILIGVGKAIRVKSRVLLGFLLLFLSVFILLTIETPPFSFINSALRQIPMFNQVFRSPFTKFSTVASLTYALFFAIGIRVLFDEVLKRTKKEIIIKLLAAGISFMLIVFTLPIFNGHFFYSRLKSAPPREYFEVFDYLKKQDPNTRVANFPQNSFWGWSFYGWPARQSPDGSSRMAGGGYGGSGFLWYAVPQPILDRAFDVWSVSNENYYWEISQAIYSKNSVDFSKIINKYQINWLFIDGNIISSNSQKDLFVAQLKDMISGLPDIKKTATFGNIDLYKVSLKEEPKKFVFLTGSLPRINGYKWGNKDIGYLNNGNYITIKNQTSQSFDYFYPFRSLFSNKTKIDQEFEVKENGDSLDFIANLYPSENTNTLSLPSFNQVENVIPIEMVSQKNDDGSISIKARMKTPEVFIKDSYLTKIWEEKRENTILTIPPSSTFPYNVNLNGAVNFSVDGAFGEKILGSAFLIKGRDNIITLTNTQLGTQNSQVISSDSIDYNSGTIDINLPKLERESQIIVRVGKIDDKYLGFVENPKSLSLEGLDNCDRFRDGKYYQELINTQNEQLLKLSSYNATACTSYYLQNLIHDQGYLILIKNSNLKGSPLHFWVLNEDEDYAPINTYLNNEKSLSDSVIILPPQEKFGLAYSFHFENPSIADWSVNNLGRIASYPIPYNYLSQVKLFRQVPIKQTPNPINFDVYHPNESLYSIRFEGKPSRGSTLILSQAFNFGWKAYGMNEGNKHGLIENIFPFLFGRELKNHVLVNNWANGWVLSNGAMKQPARHGKQGVAGGSNNDVVIVYLPQYLQYIGLILTSGTLISLILALKRKNKRPPSH